MKFIGIDPSTKTGLVVIDGDEIVLQEEITPKEKSDPERLMEIADKIISKFRSLSVSYTDSICIEGFSYGSKGKGVSTQYGIGWLIRAELIRNGYTYKEVAPSALKKFATGKGNAKKENMIIPIYNQWNFVHESDNVRDAFVLAKMAQALKGEGHFTKYQKEALEKVSK